MLNRRTFVGVAAGVAVGLTAIGADGADWKSEYPELVFAVVPSENAAGVVDRYTPFAEYLSQELGTKVTLRVANDYTAVIEGMKNRQIQIGYYGPGSYARAHKVSDGNVEAFVTTVNQDGSIGYHSVMYVMAESVYKSIDDLKGKNLGLVDVESTSGFKAPSYYLQAEGKPVDEYFANAQVTGSHENAVIALTQGTVDAAVNWWNSDVDSNLTRMLTKGMLKKADGSAMTATDFRVVWKSPLLAGSPYAYLKDMPAELKAAIQKAFTDAPQKAPEAFAKLSDGKDKGFSPVTHKDYEDFVKLNEWLETQRKSS
jgi:phosphonate transport system substrate-binding protein